MSEKIVAIDVGYGDVKVFDGEKYYKHPTAVAPYSFSSFAGKIEQDENSPYLEESIYTLDGRDYLIGNRALQDIYCKSSRSESFIFKYTPLFIYKAIEDTGFMPDTVALGIPLINYIASDSRVFKKKYKERVGKFIINSQVISIDNVEIFAQGHGIYIDCLTQEENRNLKKESVLVVDIGFNTIDILSVVEGTPTRKDSTTLVNKGVVAIIKNLQEYIKGNYNLDLSEQSVKDILLTNGLNIYGNEIDLTDIIRDIVEGYSNWLIGELEERMENATQRIKKVIIAGGGAYYIKDFIPEKYSFIYIPKSPEFANVRGYYALALWQMRKEK